MPHLFKLQDESVLPFSMPLTDLDTELAGISVYNLIDKEEVEKHAAADPAVQAGIFTYEVVSCMGIQGDKLA